MAEDENSDDGLIFKKAIESCVTAQAMIDINAEHLEGLRTQCTTTAELTQHEIRTLENKLLWLFSRQLTAKKKCSKNRNVHQLAEYPRLKQWLQVIGLKINTIECTCKHVDTLEDLLQSSEYELNKLLHDLNVNDDDIRRLLIAQRNLKSYTENQIYGYTANASDHDLSGDQSWNQNYFSRPPDRHQEDFVKSDSSALGDKTESNYAGQIPSYYPSVPSSGAESVFASTHTIDRRYTPPPTPSMVGKKGDRKFPTTPPPSKKHQANLLPDAFPLTKSKSHEEQLSNRIEPIDSNIVSSLMARERIDHQIWLGHSCENLPRRRLATEPGLETTGLINHGQVSHVSSPSRSPPFASPEQPADSCFIDDTPAPPVLPVPRSPRTRGMAHIIYHRFTPTVKVTTCHLCDKPMIIGYKCKECKFRCHRDCVDKVPPSCGLPSELVEVFVQSVREEEGEMENEGKKLHNPHMNLPGFACPDSSSNTSSCNSSSPSSPALIVTTVSHTPPLSNLIQHFNFPEVIDTKKEATLEGKESTENEMVETQKSNDSDKTTSGTSGSASTDSEKTLAGRVDSQDSQVSDADPNDKGWPRQNSLSLREWDIPYDELQISDKIGTGRFGTVCRGNWHGNVAVKMINMDPLDDKRTLDTFKQEVATFRKTRHENLVLFMGACMKPPHLAIVTSLCKGMTLYTHIHLRKDKFNINRTLAIARQITQGMGYLHARGIVHKDLKTKNIFYENGKVVITDFGLFSLTKLCERSRKGEWLAIPKGWLCYLAPEVIRSLRADNEQEGDFPFSVASDVYAFGTVWYELLCGDWPFQGLPPESVIWQVGKGIRQSLANIHSSKDIKDLIMLCWAYKTSDRPDFSKIQDVVIRQPLVPKKRLARSPSHPVHLSRSAESVF